MFHSYFLVGGAGFIGSHFIDALLSQADVQRVTVFDDFSNGQEWHYQHHLHDSRLTVVVEDVKSTERLINAMAGHEVVMHLAANADISKAFEQPSIDFSEGVLLTHQVLEAMRVNQVPRLIFMSGSGVYGEMGETPCVEHQGNLLPISPYGASKLAGEAFISSYSHMFGLTASIFRFANVVGPRQTHGVAYDFIRQLLGNPRHLRILGDGAQTKSYIHVNDVVNAVLLVQKQQKGAYEIYNVASDDLMTVKNIALQVVSCMGLKQVEFEFTGGRRGWPGDVPVIRLNTDKIRALGWRCQTNCEQSMQKSILAMLQHKGNFVC
jgi:UDP-glucose 4-epimerase